jgi:hypothetical protein
VQETCCYSKSQLRCSKVRLAKSIVKSVDTEVQSHLSKISQCQQEVDAYLRLSDKDGMSLFTLICSFHNSFSAALH